MSKPSHTSKDRRRELPIRVHRVSGRIYQLIIDAALVGNLKGRRQDQVWAAVEWSEGKRRWCIEDAAGRCLAHIEHQHGQHKDHIAAIALAKAMIRDGRMPTPEEAEQAWREREQIPTVAVSVHHIMSQPTFMLGVNDARNGRGYHRDYDQGWDVNAQESYERGRQWARLAPRSVPLKRGGKINPEAVRHYRDEII
jgi:hypothetical protein